MPSMYPLALATAYTENSSISAAALQGALVAGRLAMAQGSVSHHLKGPPASTLPAQSRKRRWMGEALSGL